MLTGKDLVYIHLPDEEGACREGDRNEREHHREADSCKGILEEKLQTEEGHHGHGGVHDFIGEVGVGEDSNLQQVARVLPELLFYFHSLVVEAGNLVLVLHDGRS